MTGLSNPHPVTCMCDYCIKDRVRRQVEEREREKASQDYIRRRGGVDPRRTSNTAGEPK
jgi:hypothetical protein